MSLVVRAAEPADAVGLAELAARTFREAFGADNRPEDLALHLAESYGTAQQGREIADPQMSTLVVEVGGELAAYAQLRRGPAPACVTGDAPLEILRFYVAKEWHGGGLAHTLMAHTFAEATRLGAATLWLGVWERNPRAIAFYRKRGFAEVGSQIFMVGNDPQTDRIMAAPLAHVSAGGRA